MEVGPRKRKAAASNLNEGSSGPIKRLKPKKQARSILESIEHGPNSDQSEHVVFDSESDGERELTWSPSPARGNPPANQASRSGSTPTRRTEQAESEHAASSFVPLPARQPTPINTLNHYFGGSPPHPTAGQSNRKTAKRKKKGMQSGPKRSLHNYFDGSRDDVVLIADLEELRKIARLGTDAKDVTFRTKAQFERHFGTPPTSADMDATCTITSFEPGIFRSKPRTWKTIEIEKQESWRDEYDMRDEKFAGLMSKVGQSGQAFRERRVTGLLNEEMSKFKTPAGERRRHHAYIEAPKAGQYNPDLLIRLEDGAYKAVYLTLYKDTCDLTSFKAVTDKYGKDNVWLKTADFDYMTHDQFDKNGTTFDAAEKMFCEYTGRAYQPNVFVRSSDETWLSKERYDKENEYNFDEDLTKLEILIMGKHNQGFVQPKTMKWQDPILYKERMEAANLAGEVATTRQRTSSKRLVSDILAEKENHSSAPVLMQSSRDKLEPIDRISRGVEYWRIYPQNVSEKTGYTGNYTRNWRSIRREEEFQKAADGENGSYLLSVDASRKPKRLMTEEQRRILKTPTPSPVQSDVSDDEELFVRQSSPSRSPVISNADQSSLASLSSEETGDEMRSPAALRRELSLPRDSSDEERAALSRGVKRPFRARSGAAIFRPSSIKRLSSPVDRPGSQRGRMHGSKEVAAQLAEPPQFPWSSDGSESELPVTVRPADPQASSGTRAERNAAPGTSANSITSRASRSPSNDTRRDRSRAVGRG